MVPAGIGDRLEGLHAVSAAVASGRVRRLWVEQQRLRSPEVERIVGLARDQGVAVDIVPDVRDRAVTSAPQGLYAEAEPLRTTSLEEAVALTDPPAVLVLDHVEDPRNLGAAARSAVAAGLRAIVVPQRRSAPLGATAFKSAAGALEHVNVVTVSSTGDALRRLRRLGVWLVGLSSSASRSLYGLDLLDEPVALVVGAEGSGLGKLVTDRLDVAVRIPMTPEVESLNVAVAVALAAFELARVRGWVT